MGAWSSAKSVLAQLYAKKIEAAAGETEIAAAQEQAYQSVSVSSILEQVWEAVLSLRAFLREYHLLDRNGDLARLTQESMHSSAGKEGETKEEMKYESEGAGAGAGAGGGGAPPTPGGEGLVGEEDLIEVPTNFEEMNQQLSQRCCFLLGIDPPARLKSSPISSGGASQLADKWHKLLPPPTLQPLLMRWSSSPGVEGTEGAKPAEAADPGSTSGPSPPLYVRTPEESVAEGNSLFPALRVGRNCLLYVLYGNAVPPKMLFPLILRRTLRATQRIYGLKAMLALLKNQSFMSARRDSMVRLRPALRGTVDWLRTSSSTSAPDPSVIRHHYLKGLEGVSSGYRDKLQSAFLQLYVYIGDLMNASSETGDAATATLTVWSWGVDFEPQDHEFLLRVGLVKSLSQLCSLRTRATDAGIAIAALSDAATPSADAKDPSSNTESAATPRVEWAPWPLEYVRKSLTTGMLTKWELILHMKMRGGAGLDLPEDNPVDRSSEELPSQWAHVAASDYWWQKQGLHQQARLLAQTLSVAKVLALYEDLTDRIQQVRRRRESDLGPDEDVNPASPSPLMSPGSAPKQGEEDTPSHMIPPLPLPPAALASPTKPESEGPPPFTDTADAKAEGRKSDLFSPLLSDASTGVRKALVSGPVRTTAWAAFRLLALSTLGGRRGFKAEGTDHGSPMPGTPGGEELDRAGPPSLQRQKSNQQPEKLTMSLLAIEEEEGDGATVGSRGATFALGEKARKEIMSLLVAGEAERTSPTTKYSNWLRVSDPTPQLALLLVL